MSDVMLYGSSTGSHHPLILPSLPNEIMKNIFILCRIIQSIYLASSRSLPLSFRRQSPQFDMDQVKEIRNGGLIVVLLLHERINPRLL